MTDEAPHVARGPVECISAVTLATHGMARAVRFYRSLGFLVAKGGPEADFTSFEAGEGTLNLIAAGADRQWSWWGRIIFYVSDVDETYRAVTAAGIDTDFAPRDAEWGERYFHLSDPDGHELSFAAPLPSRAQATDSASGVSEREDNGTS